MRLSFATVLLLSACGKSPAPAEVVAPVTPPPATEPAAPDVAATAPDVAAAAPDTAAAAPDVAAAAPDVAPAAPETAAAPAACLKFDPTEQLVGLSFKNAKLEFCHEEGTLECFAYEPTTKTLTKRDRPIERDVRVVEITKAGSGIRIHTLDKKAEHCKSDWSECKPLDLGGKTPLSGTFNDTGSFSVLFTGGEGEKPTAATFDGATKIAQFDIVTDKFGCALAESIEGGVFVSRGDCASPDGETEIYTREGKSLGVIASYPVFHATTASGVAFVEKGGLEVVVRALPDNKIVHTIDLRPSVAKNAVGEPDTKAAGAFDIGPNLVLVVLDGASQGKLVVVDTSQGTVAGTQDLPRCQSRYTSATTTP